MRALAERHRGLLPLDTVEGIWRIIISTFTYVQSNYSVHVDMSRGDAPMRDSARFHFGFTVPCVPHHGAGGVIEAVARGSGDLGMFALDGGVGAGAWWTRLCPADCAENHRPPAFRRAAGPSRRHAGFRHRQASGGRRGAGRRHRSGGARPMARRLSRRFGRLGRRDHRQRGRRHGPVVADRAPGRAGRRARSRAPCARRARAISRSRRSAPTPRGSIRRRSR